MSEILFDTLIERCVADFRKNYTSDHALTKVVGQLGLYALATMKETGKPAPHPSKMLDEIDKICVKAIRATDIRGINTLRSIVPDAFPKWLQKKYNAEINEKGDWVIYG